jgi:hypothetical protein
MSIQTLKRAVAGAAAIALGVVGATHAAASMSVTIEPASEAGQYVASASIRDLVSGALVAAPRVAVAIGQRAEAVIESPADGAPTSRFEVSIDATGTRATWRLEWRRDGRLTAASEGSVTLGTAEDGVY